ISMAVGSPAKSPARGKATREQNRGSRLSGKRMPCRSSRSKRSIASLRSNRLKKHNGELRNSGILGMKAESWQHCTKWQFALVEYRILKRCVFALVDRRYLVPERGFLTRPARLFDRQDHFQGGHSPSPV